MAVKYSTMVKGDIGLGRINGVLFTRTTLPVACIRKKPNSLKTPSLPAHLFLDSDAAPEIALRVGAPEGFIPGPVTAPPASPGVSAGSNGLMTPTFDGSLDPTADGGGCIQLHSVESRRCV